jgi:hypothetical protein
MQHERGVRTLETPFARFECSVLERANKPARSREHESVIARLKRCFNNREMNVARNVAGRRVKSPANALFTVISALAVLVSVGPFSLVTATKSMHVKCTAIQFRYYLSPLANLKVPFPCLTPPAYIPSYELPSA